MRQEEDQFVPPRNTYFEDNGCEAKPTFAEFDLILLRESGMANPAWACDAVRRMAAHVFAEQPCQS
jgi:hypothetical protein